jgi:predicted MFS family arabinose efflux permease
MSSILASVHSTRALANAAWALRVQFFVFGGLFATWGVHVPTIKAHYVLGERALALAMLAAGVGALIALSQAGRVIGRHGPRRVAWISGSACTLCLALLLASDHYAVLLLVMLGFGLSTSFFDVSINAEVSEFERLRERPLMSGFHALFSLGGMAGAAFVGALLGAGVPPSGQLIGIAVGAAVVIAAAAAAMLPMKGPPPAPTPRRMPRGVLLLMGLLGAMGLVAEGAMYDWSVLYLRQELHSDAATAALAYASFSAAMAAGRFGGDWVRARLASVPLLQASGALGAAGMMLALMVHDPLPALVGFALVGLGFANIVPVLFSAAAKVPGVTPAQGIATVSAVGFLGMMVGPPLIGVIAEARSLTLGLCVVVVFAAVLALAARSALRETG